MAQPLVPDEVLQALSHVLTNLLSIDGTTRSAAEQQLNDQWAKQQPDVLLCALAQLVSSSPDENLRAHSCVLLRRLAFSSPAQSDEEGSCLWETASDQTRASIKGLLLKALEGEGSDSLKHKISDALAEVARFALNSDATRQAFMMDLFQCLQSSNGSLRESTFRILSVLPELLPEDHVADVKNTFLSGLTDPSNESVRISAMKATIEYIAQADEDVQAHFVDLMPNILQPLSQWIMAHDDEKLTEGLISLIFLATEATRLFRPVFADVQAAMLSVTKDKSFENSTRRSALELLMTIAEEAPKMVRKHDNFCSEMIPVALEMMTEIDDDQDWYTTEEIDEEDEDENYTVGESVMDRLSCTLGGKFVVPTTFKYVPEMLQSSQWQQRRAGLMAISSVAEGSEKMLRPELGKIIDMILPLFQDPHPRVRYTACNALGQMSTDFAPFLQKKFHKVTMEKLLSIMDDPQPRVQAHAAAAMVNFCEEADKKIIQPYLDPLLQKLLVLLNTNKVYVQEQALTTIATVADCIENQFIKYQSTIVPILLQALKTTDKKYLQLRCRAIECASLIALAVGKEAFAPYTVEFIESLKALQDQSNSEEENTQTTYLLAAWTRMSKVLGQDFLVYLPYVMPPLMRSASLTPEFAYMDPDEDVEANYPSEDGWNVVGMHGQKIGIKTSMMEEKHTAMEMLESYANDLGAGFFPYVKDVFLLALPLLKFYFHDGVRHSAAKLIPSLIRDAKEAQVPQPELLQMWNQTYEKIKQLRGEDDIEFLSQLYCTFYQCVELLGEGSLPPQLLESFTDSIKDQLEAYAQRLEQREKEKKSGEYDAEDDEELAEEEMIEEGCLAELARAIQAIFKTCHAGYFSHFEKILGHVVQFSKLDNEATVQWSICVFDDVIEYTGADSARYQEFFLPLLVQGVKHKSTRVRQAAAYGIGVCAQFGNGLYNEACLAALGPLFEVTQEPEAREDDNVYVTENAISAIAKVCKACDFPNRDDAIGQWISTLPVLNDEQEAPFVYTFLLELLESNHPRALGPNNANIPHLVNVFTEALASDLVSDDLASRMANCLKVILAGVDEATRSQLWNAIPPENQKVLQDKGYV